MQTDILFGQSYFLHFDPKLAAANQPYPPLGTLYAASYVREQGYSVALFDAILAESEAEWESHLRQYQPRVAVLYEDNFNYLSKMCLLRMREAAQTMIGMAKGHGCPIIVAGSDASDHWAGYLAAGADYVLFGEGEETLAELMGVLLRGDERPLSTILGLAYVDEGGKAKRTAARPPIKAVDALPFPAWDLVDVPRYRAIWQAHHGYYAMNMVTTRGCPYHCNWCAKPIWGQRYNGRSAANVVAELAWLRTNFQPDYIWFADDIMGLKPGWWAEFADLVEAKGVRVPFKCLSRADLIVRHGAAEVSALARAGCEIIWLGAESGSQKILDAMEKGTTVAQIYEAAEKLHEAGIRVGFFLQFGYPGESRADIEQTLQMVRDCQPDDIGMSVSYPLPGTRFYENVRGQLGEKQNWQDSADLAMMYRGPFATPFYRQLHVVMHKEFRARKGWREVWENPHKRPLSWRVRGVAAVAYRWLTLPLARWQLNRLAQLPHTGLPPAPHMSLQEAARPSVQD